MDIALQLNNIYVEHVLKRKRGSLADGLSCPGSKGKLRVQPVTLENRIR
jgi:hypothetical protein